MTITVHAVSNVNPTVQGIIFVGDTHRINCVFRLFTKLPAADFGKVVSAFIRSDVDFADFATVDGTYRLYKGDPFYDLPNL
jgi:hypothetical protein